MGRYGRWEKYIIRDEKDEGATMVVKRGRERKRKKK